MLPHNPSQEFKKKDIKAHPLSEANLILVSKQSLMLTLNPMPSNHSLKTKFYAQYGAFESFSQHKV